jgi:hypothetical protein
MLVNVKVPIIWQVSYGFAVEAERGIEVCRIDLRAAGYARN